MHRFTKLAAAALFSVAIVVAARSFGAAVVRVAHRADTLEVKGSASDDLRAETATVKVTLFSEAPREDAAERRAEKDRAALLAWLEAAGVKAASIEASASDAEQVYTEDADGASTGKVRAVRVARTFTLGSIPVDAADRIAQRAAELDRQGLTASLDGPTYHFPGRAEAEKRVIEAAARDARERAARILRAAGGEAGGLRSLEVNDARVTPFGADEDGQGGSCGAVRTLRATVTATYEVAS